MAILAIENIQKIVIVGITGGPAVAELLQEGSTRGTAAPMVSFMQEMNTESAQLGSGVSGTLASLDKAAVLL